MNLIIFAVCFAFVPLFALAQEAGTGAITYKGFDLTPVITILLTLAASAFSWAKLKIAKANEAAAQKENAAAAFVRLGAIAFAMAGELWGVLSAEFQTRIADGKIDADDRAAFKSIIEQKIEKFTSKAELEKLAKAANLPLPGVIAWVAEYVIDRITKAHDASNSSVSAKAFPAVENPLGDAYGNEVTGG